MSRRTVGACTAINGERLAMWEPARQLSEPGEHLGCSWPRSQRRRALGSPLAPARSLVAAIALVAATAADRVSLLGWDYCVWPTLKMVWTKVHKLSWKGATRLVCKHARSGRLLAEQNWLSPCPSRCSPRSFASPGFTIHLCALECGILISQAGLLG